MPFSLGLYQTRLFQDSHVMRNGRLRQLHTLLDIEGAEPGFLVQRASAFFFERVQNPAARRISNGVQEAIKIGSSVGHDELVIV